MPRSAPLVLAGVILLHSTLLSQAPARDPVRTSGTGVMRGTVRDVDGTPLRKVLIRLNGSSLAEPRAVYTDDQGRYELTAVPPGRYAVNATKSRYLAGSPGRVRVDETPLQVELAPGQVLEPLDITLWLAGAITGQVVDEYGDPVPGANVAALRRQSVQGTDRLVPAAGLGQGTDDEGRFRLFGLAPSSYIVMVTLRRPTLYVGDAGANIADDRSGYAPTYYPGTPDSASAALVRVETGETKDGIEIRLQAIHVATVSGTIVDSAGNPVSSGMLQLLPDGAAIPTSPLAGTPRGGRFVVNQVPPGRYTLQAMTLPPNGAREVAFMPIDVTGADVTGLVVRTIGPSTMHGRFEFDDWLAARLRPAMLRPGFRPVGPARLAGAPMPPVVHDDFSFDVSVFPGTYDLTVAAIGVRDVYVRAMRIGGEDVLDRSIEVAANANISGVEIELTDRATALEGTLQASGPLRPFVVIVFARDPALRTRIRRVAAGRPDQYGRYALRGLLPGDYYAAAIEEQPEAGAQDPAFLARLQPLASPVTLVEDETTTLDLPLVKAP